MFFTSRPLLSAVLAALVTPLCMAASSTNEAPSFALPPGDAWVARSIERSWKAVASSADGTKLVAVANPGRIYTSIDSGITWTAQGLEKSWEAVTSSADGSKLVAVETFGKIYTSGDSGVTWTARESDRYWRAVASSTDGTKLAAVAGADSIYISSDSGVTWTPRGTPDVWTGLAMSADGTKLVAVATNSQVKVSADSGATWSPVGNARAYTGVTCSADGTKIAATIQNSSLAVSSDSGVTWSLVDSSRNWKSIASSADGTKLGAVTNDGRVYLSDNSGHGWYPMESRRLWNSIACSSDGAKWVTSTSSGKLYTWMRPPMAQVVVPASSGAYSQVNFATNIQVGSHVDLQSQIVTLQVTNNNNALFTAQPNINSTTGELTFTPSGTEGTALVTVTAHDTGGNVSPSIDTSVPQVFRISLRGNTAPSNVTFTPVAEPIYENNVPGVALGQLSVTDPDANDVVSYMLESFGLFSRHFALDGNTLRLVSVTDYETQKTFPIRIYATDLAGGQTSISLSISISDVNERPNFSLPSEAWKARGSGPAWNSIASSADGMTLVAAEAGLDQGQLLQSTDAGNTWTSIGPMVRWNSADISGDGRKIVASSARSGAPGDISVLTRTPTGGSSVTGGPSEYWQTTAISKDGSTIVAAAGYDNVYVSRDGGYNWTMSPASYNCFSVALSADGSKIYAVDKGNQIMKSTDYGVSWTGIGSTQYWEDVACSDDGNVVIGVVSQGRVQVSTNGGASFDVRGWTSDWDEVKCSANGQIIMASSIRNEQPYFSTDMGLTWSRIGGHRPARFFACSADGQKWAATGGGIFTFQIGQASSIQSAGDSGARTYPNFLADLVNGPANEPGQTFAFSCSNNNNSLFSAQPTISADGALQFTAAAGATGTAIVSVSSQDSGGVANGGQDTSVTKTFTINVVSNAAPTDIALSNLSVPENQSPPSVVGVLSATDADANDVATFTLASGTGDTDNSAFSITGNELRLNVFADYETKNSYSVRIRVTDDGASYEEALTIAITNVNEGAYGLGLSPNQISENNEVGAIVGSLSVSDFDVGDTHTFTIQNVFLRDVDITDSPLGQGFEIVNGQLKINFVADYEATSWFSLLIRVTDAGGLSRVLSTSCNILDANEAPVNFTLSNSSLYENNLGPVVVGTFSATDLEGNNPVRYSLATGSGDDDNGLFSIDSNTLIFTGRADYEAKSEYTIRVRTYDSWLNGKEANFVITIGDNNDAPTFTLPGTQSVTGQSWETISTDPYYQWGAVTMSDSGQYLSAVERWGQLVTSNDGGRTWTARSVVPFTPVGGGEGEEGGILLLGEGDYIPARMWDGLCASADGQTIYASTNGKIYRSTNGGKIWQAVYDLSDEHSPAFNLLSCDVDGSSIVAASYYGQLMVSHDSGQTWAYLDHEFNYFRRIALDQLGQRIAVVDWLGVHLSIDSGLTWTTLLAAEDALSVTMSRDGQRLAVLNINGSVKLSSDGGSTWQQKTLPYLNTTYISWTQIVGSPDGRHLAAVNNSEVLISNDFGQTWASSFFPADSYAKELAISEDGQSLIAPASYHSSMYLSKGRPSPVITADSSQGLFTQNTFLTNLIAGPASESAQNVTLNLSTSDLALFAVPPAIDLAGTLTFTPLEGASGTAKITITAQDDGGTQNGGQDTSAPQYVYIVIYTDLAPTDLTIDSEGTFPENAPGHTVGTLTVVDPDGDAHTLSLVSGTGDQDNGDFQIFGKTLILATAANYEQKTSYSVRIRATGDRGTSIERQFSFSVIDVNEAPVFTIPNAGPGLAGETWTSVLPSSLDILDHCMSSDGQRLFVSTYAGRLYRSMDGGATWAAIAPGNRISRVSCTPDGSRVFASGSPDEGLGRSPYWLSLDAGNTWTEVAQEFTTNNRHVALSDDGSRLIAAGKLGEGEDALLKSDDGGATWSTSLLPDYPWSFAASGDGTKLMMISGTVLYRSEDFGVSWNPVYSEDEYLEDIALSADGETCLAAVWPGLIYSHDGGETWGAYGSFDYFNGVALTPDGSVFLASGYDQLLRSVDHGATWESLPLTRSVEKLTTNSNGFKLTAQNYEEGFLISNGVKPHEIIVDASSEPFTQANFATDIKPAIEGETDQTVSFLVYNSNGPLFSSRPSISSDGTLRFTPAPGMYGTAKVSVIAFDNAGPPPIDPGDGGSGGEGEGGGEGGGEFFASISPYAGTNTSEVVTFLITIEQPHPLEVRNLNTTSLVQNDGQPQKVGLRRVGSLSGSISFHIENRGPDLMTEVVVALEEGSIEDFSFTQPSQLELPPSWSNSFEVSFTPTVRGKRAVTLLIYTNGLGSANPFRLYLEGEGITDTYADWRDDHFEGQEVDAENEQDFDGDGITNIMEFAFGTQPDTTSSGTENLQFNGSFSAGGTITQPGLPILLQEGVINGVDFRAIFMRRKDYQVQGLIYTPQFSANLSVWQSSNETPTVLADDGTYQIVSVSYPRFIQGKKARFYRLLVNMAP